MLTRYRKRERLGPGRKRFSGFRAAWWKIPNVYEARYTRGNDESRPEKNNSCQKKPYRSVKWPICPSVAHQRADCAPPRRGTPQHGSPHKPPVPDPQYQSSQRESAIDLTLFISLNFSTKSRLDMTTRLRLWSLSAGHREIDWKLRGRGGKGWKGWCWWKWKDVRRGGKVLGWMKCSTKLGSLWLVKVSEYSISWPIFIG